VTPMDPNFPVDAGYTVPGAYFSPLTSPALHAQTEPLSVYDQRPSSTSTNSPGQDVEPPAAQNSAADLSKKARKNNATKSSRKSNVRQSPISKPQRRKTQPSQAMVSQVLSEINEPSSAANGNQADKQASASVPMATEETEENGSVSPETLSDMPPPPIPQPRSAGRSPYINPQKSGHTAGFATSTSGNPSPATPATLMKLPVSNGAESTSSNPVEPTMTEAIENFELPESVNFSKPKLSPLDTQSMVLSPPEPSSAKTPFQPLPSPVFAKPSAAASSSQSPQLAPGPSGPTRKTPQLAPRGCSSLSRIAA
jgi:hypothetical protein